MVPTSKRAGKAPASKRSRKVTEFTVGELKNGCFPIPELDCVVQVSPTSNGKIGEWTERMIAILRTLEAAGDALSSINGFVPEGKIDNVLRGRAVFATDMAVQSVESIIRMMIAVSDVPTAPAKGGK